MIIFSGTDLWLERENMAKKRPKIERRCEKCGKLQPIVKEKSNENWKVYDPKAICECGGKYVFVQVEE